VIAGAGAGAGVSVSPVMPPARLRCGVWRYRGAILGLTLIV
jgi:hypothetical protein